MDNKIVNKQITIKSIVELANYFEDYKEKYEGIFRRENAKNKDLERSERNFEYENGSAELKYCIKFNDGRSMTETDYNWFIGELDSARDIEEISVDLRVSYYTKSGKDKYNDLYNNIYASVYFRDARMNLKYSDATVDVNTTNRESEANDVYNKILDILEKNEDRYNKTIKNRKVRMQAFCISVGIIISYILFVILKINMNKISPDLVVYLTNKNAIVFGQWFISILLGNVFSYWYILSVYKPLLPSTKYAGYNSSSHKSVYKDDIDEYLQHSEVHFGKYWDAEKRRNKIEKIFKVSKYIVLIQVIISALLYLIIK